MRVVLVRLSAIGDIVHTWPLAEALRRTHDELRLEWVVEEAFHPLVEAHPALSATVTVNTRRWRRSPLSSRTRSEVATLKQHLRRPRPELCIDAQGVAKSALIARWTRARQRVGLAHPWRRERLAGLAYNRTVPGSTHHHHVVATNLELVRALGGVPPQDLPHPDGAWLLERCRQEPTRHAWGAPFGVLLAGTAQPSKTLPEATLVAVAQGMARLGLETVVAWGPAERERAARVAVEAGRGVHLAPATDLEQLVALLADARVVVGGDTGPVHLAASLGVATLGIYLTTSCQRNGPLGPRVRTISAVADTDQRPTGSARARQVREVKPAEILAAVEGLVVGGGKCYNSQGLVSGVDE